MYMQQLPLQQAASPSVFGVSSLTQSFSQFSLQEQSANYPTQEYLINPQQFVPVETSSNYNKSLMNYISEGQQQNQASFDLYKNVTILDSTCRSRASTNDNSSHHQDSVESSRNQLSLSDLHESGDAILIVSDEERLVSSESSEQLPGQNLRAQLEAECEMSSIWGSAQTAADPVMERPAMKPHQILSKPVVKPKIVVPQRTVAPSYQSVQRQSNACKQQHTIAHPKPLPPRGIPARPQNPAPFMMEDVCSESTSYPVYNNNMPYLGQFDNSPSFFAQPYYQTNNSPYSDFMFQQHQQALMVSQQSQFNFY